MFEVASSKWNASVGLFRKEGPGHTEPVSREASVHSFPETFIRFAVDAQLGRLDQERLRQALEVLAKAQIREPGKPLRGCLRWYYEEPEPIDTNASFFVGLALLVLDMGYAERVGEANRRLMEPIFEGLRDWFATELQEDKRYYPNKFLGDLVCAWLLAERTGEDALLEDLSARFADAMGYWRSDHWGWGEHLSQVYTTVMLTEISAFLLLQKNFPPPLADQLRELGDELLRIQDFFGRGPWTPAIRYYAFSEVPTDAPYREEVRPWNAFADAAYLETLPEYRFMRVCFATFFDERGWHALFPRRAKSEQDTLTLACIGGVEARAWKKGPVRLGSLTRYPLRAEWDADRWGLSWQSFPVAAACDKKLWAFPQWRVRWLDGTDRCHPAHVKSAGYLSNALVPDGNCFTGQTEGRQEGPACAVQRTLPTWHPQWAAASDGWNLIVRYPVETREFAKGEEHFLEVTGGEFVLTVSCRPPDGRPLHLFRSDAAPHIRWELPLEKADAARAISWSVRITQR